MCVQIPWDRNPEALAKWAEGLTGYPWIDAIMTQLRQEGWIHHLARHAVACFLTRGDLDQLGRRHEGENKETAESMLFCCFDHVFILGFMVLLCRFLKSCCWMQTGV